MKPIELRQVRKKLKRDLTVCPLCNRVIDLTSYDADKLEYVKTATGTLNVYHTDCIKNFMKGGEKQWNT